MKRDVAIAVGVGILFLALGFFFMNRNLRQAAEVERTMKVGVAATPMPIDTTKPAPKTNETKTQGTISLSVVAPSEVDMPSVTISGTTAPEAEVSVDDKDIMADKSGKFSASVSLLEGDNYITVLATTADGEYLEREIVVTYTPKAKNV